MADYCIVINEKDIRIDGNIVETTMFYKVLPPIYSPSVCVQFVSFLILFPFSAFCHPLELCHLESVLGPPEFIKNNFLYIHMFHLVHESTLKMCVLY